MSKQDDIEYCARMLGVEPGDVIEALPDPDGVMAQTSDGRRTLIRDNGELQAIASEAGAVKPASKRRSSS